MNNLERMSPADLEALYQYADRHFEAAETSEEKELWSNTMLKISRAQRDQFHRIIVEGKPPANKDTLLPGEKWDPDIELNTKTGEMNVSHLPGEKPPTDDK